MTRQKGARKGSFHVVNEHIEPFFNAASADQGINQSFINPYSASALFTSHRVTNEVSPHTQAPSSP